MKTPHLALINREQIYASARNNFKKMDRIYERIASGYWEGA